VKAPPPGPVTGWLLAACLALAMFFVPLPAWIVDEFYSRDFYPWLQNGLTAFSNLFPVALMDVLIIAAVLAVLYRLAMLVVVARHVTVRAAVWQGVRRIVRAAAVLVAAFLFTWGCNYRRIPLEATLTGGARTMPSTETLETAVLEANALAAALRPSLQGAPPRTFDEVAAALEGPMNTALARLNLEPLRRPGRPKFSVILTPFFTWAGVNGMVDPFMLESLLHPGLLSFERPFVLAHEWAHLAGEADEAEASTVGWLACLNGPPPAAYSASLFLIMEGAAALPPAARRRVGAALDAGVRADINAIAKRAEAEKPQVQYAASRVYDHYLKANRVADGAASYSRALSLILSPTVIEAMGQYRQRR
jgi:hypothetical protein